MQNENTEIQTSELDFRLASAFSELQASVRLLPDSDPRKQALTSIAAAVNAVREVV